MASSGIDGMHCQRTIGDNAGAFCEFMFGFEERVFFENSPIGYQAGQKGISSEQLVSCDAEKTANRSTSDPGRHSGYS